MAPDVAERPGHLDEAPQRVARRVGGEMAITDELVRVLMQAKSACGYCTLYRERTKGKPAPVAVTVCSWCGEGQELDRAIALEAARADVLRWAEHAPACDDWSGEPCDCGFKDAWARLVQAEAALRNPPPVTMEGTLPSVEELERARESRGLWRCSCCGEAYTAEPGTQTWPTAWRCNGKAMEHKCPGNDPQHGYELARWLRARWLRKEGSGE